MFRSQAMVSAQLALATINVEAITASVSFESIGGRVRGSLGMGGLKMAA